MILDDCTPGAEQICTLSGVSQELMTGVSGIPQTGVDNPQRLTFLHESSARRFYVDPSTVEAYQVDNVEGYGSEPLPTQSAVDLGADCPHLFGN